MKKLYKLILGAYIGPFILTFFITLFILVMQFLWKYIDEMVGKGLEYHIILELLFYASANLVPMALPLAVLLSSIMTYGNMGEHYELVAFKSAGLSLLQMMKPIMLFTSFIALLTFGFANFVWPVANLKFATLLYDIRHKKPAIDIKEKVFYKEIDNYVLRINSKSDHGETLHDFLLYDHTGKVGNRKVIRAEKGNMSMSDDETKLIITLENGYSYDEGQPKDPKSPLFRNKFEKEILRIDLSGFALERTEEDIFKNNYKMLNMNQLSNEVDTLYTTFYDRISKLGNRINGYSTLLADSITNFNAVDSLKPLTRIDSVPLDRQAKIFHAAVNNCRKANNYVDMISRILDSNHNQVIRYRLEWHRKITISLACLILFFIGAPLGAIIRKGGLGMPMLASILMFIVYYTLSITGEKLAKEEALTPHTGMWLSTIVLFPIGVFLTYKAVTDSTLLDAELYQNLIKKVVSPFKRFMRK